MNSRVNTLKRDKFKKLLKAMLPMAGVYLMSGCSTGFVNQIPGSQLFSPVQVSVSKPFVIVQSEKGYGWGYLSHPSILRATPALLAVNYNTEGDGGGAPVKELQEMRPAVSVDQGRTWAYGYESIPEYAKKPLHVSVKQADGELYYSARIKVRNAIGYLQYQRVNTNGSIYERGRASVALPMNSRKTGWLSHTGYESPDGKIWLAGYMLELKDEHAGVILIGSSDGGVTFDEFKIVATIDQVRYSSEGPNECALWGFDDGEMLCVMRTGGAYATGKSKRTYVAKPMLIARSTDYGDTWSYSYGPRGVMPKLLEMENGVLVLAFGRPGCYLAFSTDRGKSWSKEVEIVPPSAKTSGYIDIEEFEPGRLLAVYDKYNTAQTGLWLWEPKICNTVYGVFVDVMNQSADNHLNTN